MRSRPIRVTEPSLKPKEKWALSRLRAAYGRKEFPESNARFVVHRVTKD